MSEAISPGTNTWPVPIVFDLLVPHHPVFDNISNPYGTGVSAMASPFPGTDWDLTTGSMLARATPSIPSFTGNGPIIANETQSYRSVYFSHYIENKWDGSNAQDAQLFYNALTWTGAVPEPGTLMMLGLGFGGLWVTRRART
jgi:hypothetical protein